MPKPGSLLLAFISCLVCASSHASEHAWTQDKVSPAINYADRAMVVVYDLVAEQATGKVAAVHASRAYGRDELVQTSLCWNGTDRCVPLTGGSTHTKAFNGLDATKPFYLVHKVVGKGSLPTPLFIKGTVTVWFGL